MKRSSAASLQFLTSASSMSSRSSYRGGRNQWRRGFSDRPQYSSGGRGPQLVTGDSHFRSVQETNSGIRQAAGPQPYNQSQHRPQPPRYYPNPHFRRPPFDQSQGFQRPRPPKASDYRDWQYSKTAPRPNSENFIVLSYNILADYLAINHWRKLYFHIPRHMLDWEWRMRSILFELRLWSADIMCFQEVDRFQDLADQLKPRGYSGIWKMRTGNAVDGCAIFWRTSRFKLLHEESIEFNKLGLRDNVAQICVLELMSNNCTSNTSALPTSSAGSDKVIMCNIHVLYNPKRGEIKLGQVRMLLDRAYAVSKMWNAPIVLCGDFNCTPKSPLYNFISEQKLDLSGIDRDKVSGQASSEIRAPRQNNPNYIPNPNANPRILSSDNSSQTPLVINNKLDDSLSDMQKQNIPNDDSIPSVNNCSAPQVMRTMLAVSDASCAVLHSGSIKETKEMLEDVIDGCKEGTESTISVLINRFEENLTTSHRENESDLIHKSTPTGTSHSEETYPDKNEMEWTKSACPSNQVFCCENSPSNICKENKDINIDNLAQSLEVSPLPSSGYLSSHPIANDENSDLLTACQANISSGSTGLYYEGEEKLEDASPGEVNDFQLEHGMVGEDQNTFLSALHDKEDSFQTDFGQITQSDLAHFQSDCISVPIDPQVHSHGNEVLDGVSLDLDSESVTVDKTAYNPSLWTPMEVATATGNADCTFLEHPLKLKSAYAEVEDCSGTRDPNGEPLVTSYNRCFLGTVDYIWKSEGLQTIRVLAPIPKHAMQWTPGFPTKKWGSDHIALASELAFTKDATDNQLEVHYARD
ncbi:carbon catabolite repressor protein 4 homolog 6 isoform X2 [Ricinus communis]|uniref:carbon catabolite repressor protein 4 homolog 6 isoform X2 n=1 Tax=Ricinus communis TaxID=3988 RepID=UPI00201AC425|nr:carbon catabolite repressor protein 4 homolog 6 isoform X2 [Ricinus communis]